MTWNQIKSKFSHQYVGLTDICRNEQGKIVSANVVCSTLETAYEKMLELAMDNKIYMVNPAGDDEPASGYEGDCYGK